jgi:RimJ/RimL family protein N-acetyltransferase
MPSFLLRPAFLHNLALRQASDVDPSASGQRTGIDTEAKFLLLRHAFDVMNCVRVQFTTDELNQKSRATILRIGAKQEGMVRHERIMPDRRKRNSVRFSIIDAGWPEVRAGLEPKIACTEG